MGEEVNREFIRNFNRINKSNYSKQDIQTMIALTNIMQGKLSKDMELGFPSLKHYDNPEMFPDGILVKLNYEKIKQRNQNELTEDYKKFIEQNKDNEFHLTREDKDTGLVALEEDRRKTILDGKEVNCPRFLFDMLSDLLVKDENDNWIPAYEFEIKKLKKDKKSI